MVHNLLLRRKSIVCFSDRPIDKKIIESLFEAARWAPSSNNQQPWRYIFGQQSGGTTDLTYNKLFSCLSDNNKVWAKYAPLLILSIAEHISGHSGKENNYALHDLGLANFSLITQAMASDIYVHPMGGFDKTKAKELFQIPDEFVATTMLALGYKGNISNFPDELQKRELEERKRKNINETVFTELFGNPAFGKGDL